MGAVEPEPEKPKPQQYEVTAPTEVLGHEPGEKFEDVLDPTQEAQLLQGGALRKLDTGRKAQTKKEK